MTTLDKSIQELGNGGLITLEGGETIFKLGICSRFFFTSSSDNGVPPLSHGMHFFSYNSITIIVRI